MNEEPKPLLRIENGIVTYRVGLDELAGRRIRKAIDAMDHKTLFWTSVTWVLFAAAVICILIGVIGCSTPVTMLKNDSTGQTARCGGDSSGSMMGGIIGYSAQQSDAEKCVHDYEAQGFKRVSN